MMDQQSKKFFGTVKGGHLKLEDAQAFKDHCSLFNDRQIYIIVNVAYPKASKKQFGYFYGYVLKEASKHTGYTEKEMKRILKNEFLSHQDEKGKNVVPSLETLNTKEFVEFVEDCVRFLAEKADVVLEPPGGWDEPGEN